MSAAEKTAGPDQGDLQEIARVLLDEAEVIISQVRIGGDYPGTLDDAARIVQIAARVRDGRPLELQPGEFHLVAAGVDQAVEELGLESRRLRDSGLTVDHPSRQELEEQADSLRRTAAWLFDQK